MTFMVRNLLMISTHRWQGMRRAGLASWVVLLAVLVVVASATFAEQASAASEAGASTGDPRVGALLDRLEEAWKLPPDGMGRLHFSIEQGGRSTNLQGAFAFVSPEVYALTFDDGGHMVVDGEFGALYPEVTGAAPRYFDSVLGTPIFGLAIFPIRMMHETTAALRSAFREGRARWADSGEIVGRRAQAVEWDIYAGTSKAGMGKIWLDEETGLVLSLNQRVEDPQTQDEFKTLNFSSSDWLLDESGAVKSFVIKTEMVGSVIECFFEKKGSYWFPSEVFVKDGPEDGDASVQSRVSGLVFQTDLKADELRDKGLTAYRDRFLTAAKLSLQKKYQEAIPEWEAVAQMNPYSLAAHSSLGYAYLEVGDEAAGTAEYEQVLMLLPDDPMAMNNVAYAYIDRGVNLDRGIELAEKAAKMLPKSAAVRDTLGWGYYRKGRYEDAVRELEESLRLMESSPEEPKEWAAQHYHLGMAYLKLGRVQDAKQQLELAVGKDPNLYDAKKVLQGM